MARTNTPTNALESDRSPRPVDCIDFINGESRELTAILNLIVISCRALSRANEVDDGIGRDDVNKALDGIAYVLAFVQERCAAINPPANALFAATTGGAR